MTQTFVLFIEDFKNSSHLTRLVYEGAFFWVYFTLAYIPMKARIRVRKVLSKARKKKTYMIL